MRKTLITCSVMLICCAAYGQVTTSRSTQKRDSVIVRPFIPSKGTIQKEAPVKEVKTTPVMEVEEAIAPTRAEEEAPAVPVVRKDIVSEGYRTTVVPFILSQREHTPAVPVEPKDSTALVTAPVIESQDSITRAVPDVQPKDSTALIAAPAVQPQDSITDAFLDVLPQDSTALVAAAVVQPKDSITLLAPPIDLPQDTITSPALISVNAMNNQERIEEREAKAKTLIKEKNYDDAIKVLWALMSYYKDEKMFDKVFSTYSTIADCLLSKNDIPNATATYEEQKSEILKYLNKTEKDVEKGAVKDETLSTCYLNLSLCCANLTGKEEISDYYMAQSFRCKKKK